MVFRRTILKQELAEKLFPDSINSESAMQLLRKEIRETPKLRQQIYRKNSSQLHDFTHKQLGILLDHFCISPEEFEQLF